MKIRPVFNAMKITPFSLAISHHLASAERFRLLLQLKIILEYSKIYSFVWLKYKRCRLSLMRQKLFHVGKRLNETIMNVRLPFFNTATVSDLLVVSDITVSLDPERKLQSKAFHNGVDNQELPITYHTSQHT